MHMELCSDCIFPIFFSAVEYSIVCCSIKRKCLNLQTKRVIHITNHMPVQVGLDNYRINYIRIRFECISYGMPSRKYCQSSFSLLIPIIFCVAHIMIRTSSIQLGVAQRLSCSRWRVKKSFSFLTFYCAVLCQVPASNYNTPLACAMRIILTILVLF